MKGRRTFGPLPSGPRAPAAINKARLVQWPIESLVEWRKRYGDIYTVSLPGFGVGVYVCDPDAIRMILTGDQSDLDAGRTNAFRSAILGDSSVLVLNGHEHKRQRKLLLRAFRKGPAEHTFRHVIREIAEAEVDRWGAGERLIMRDRMRALTFEVTARAVFGIVDRDRIERLRSALVSLFGVAFVLLPRFLRRDLGRLGPWGWFQRRLKVVDTLLYGEIARRRVEADLEQRTDVLSRLLCARDEEGKPMAEVELRDALMAILLAGYETTATSLAFAFDLLPRNPRIFSRLRDELKSKDDAYLNAVVAETLRLRPPVDASVRTLAEPRRICDWELPRGIRIYPAIAVVHLREDLYPQPYEFRPERFIEKQILPYSWLPFGIGIRHCIGSSLALVEMAEVIRTVISRVELELMRPNPEPVVMRGLTLVPRHGTPVRVWHSGARP